MTKLAKRPYIDIRFYLDSEIEDFGDGDTYTKFDISSLERIKAKGITEDELDSFAETVAQSDNYQIYLFNDIVHALTHEGEFESGI